MAPCFSSSLSSPAIAAAILPALRPALFSVSEPAVLTHAKHKSGIKKKKLQIKKKSRIKKEVADKKKKSRIKKKKSMSLPGHRSVVLETHVLIWNRQWYDFLCWTSLVSPETPCFVLSSWFLVLGSSWFYLVQALFTIFGYYSDHYVSANFTSG